MNPLAMLVYGMIALSSMCEGGPGVIIDGISEREHVTLNGTAPTSGGRDEDWR